MNRENQQQDPALLQSSSRAVIVIVLAAALALVLLAVAVILVPTWGDVLVLGVVEGITEFLPISSTGHLLITADLLHFQNNIGGTFEIFIQLGTILAVVVYYARDLISQARSLPTSPATRRFWFSILLAFLPAAVIGFVFRGWIKRVLFASPPVIAWALIIGGIVLILVEQLPITKRQDTVHDVEGVSFLQAIGVGAAQVLALVPGVSRSGASIVGGMLGGLDRPTATAFSFYLAIPTLGAATVVDLLGSLHELTAGDIGRLAVGALVSFVVAWLCIGWFLRYVAHHTFVAFGIYRIIAGILILVLVFAGKL
ncbi:MAG: undecaprenyl-diphosphate phosphatase [Chloroflexia bacterium]